MGPWLYFGQRSLWSGRPNVTLPKTLFDAELLPREEGKYAYWSVDRETGYLVISNVPTLEDRRFDWYNEHRTRIQRSKGSRYVRIPTDYLDHNDVPHLAATFQRDATVCFAGDKRLIEEEERHCYLLTCDQARAIEPHEWDSDTDNVERLLSDQLIHPDQLPDVVTNDGIREIYEDQLAGIPFDEFSTTVREKVEQMGGLADEEIAALLEAHDISQDLRQQDQLISDISDIDPDDDVVRFVAKIDEIGELDAVELGGGDSWPFLACTVGDTTGAVRIVFWDDAAEAATDELQEGDVLRIEGHPREFGNEPVMHVADVERADDVDIPFINVDPTWRSSAAYDETTTETDTAEADETVPPSGSESAPDELEARVLDTMRQLDDGHGVDRETLISIVLEDPDVSSDDVTMTIQDLLMKGKCYEAEDGTLKAI